MPTEGNLKEKNWFKPEIRTTQMRPMTQARKVDDGIVGSSVLATAERTSRYGDSSSSAVADGSKFGSSWSSMAMPCVCPTDSECQMLVHSNPGGGNREKNITYKRHT